MNEYSLIPNVFGTWKEGVGFEYSLQPEHYKKFLLFICLTLYTLFSLFFQ